MRFQNCIDSDVLSRDSGTVDGLKIWEKTKAQFFGGLQFSVLIQSNQNTLHIGEFISQYTLVELDKMVTKSNHVLGKF